MTIWRPWWALVYVGAALLLGCGDSPAGQTVGGAGDGSASGRLPIAADEGSESAGSAGSNGEDAGGGEHGLGPGFVVWESNRGGAWRIWIRELAGGPPRRLSPDEPGKTHCCAHISPDGRRIVYLSGQGGTDEYPPDGMPGALRLIAPDGSGDRVVAPEARSYFENRAVVWRSAEELIHIDGERATVALDLAGGGSRRLADPPAERGWLIDPTLSWATTGRPGFAPYDAVRQAVVPRRVLGGCQPYLSRDGRWGFWTAGAGGPIDRLELAGERLGTILEKNDPRVPDGFGYAYFPMLSADGRLFAWAASRGGHDHFSTDYEVFVAESDPDTLELIGPPLRVTRHAATDRFPDVWQPPLELGRNAGEAPLTVRLAAPSAGDWRWEFGDGGSADGPAVEHVWSEPGRYGVVARGDGKTLRGLAVVRPPRPPRALSATARAGGLELRVAFDEEIDAGAAEIGLASGAEVAGRAVGDDGRSLVVRLAEPLRSVDRVTLSGVRDRAQRPNTMAPATLAVEPPAWPVSRAGLVFLWETADAANLVPDAELGADRAYALAAGGAARLDADFAMLTAGGTFTLERGETARLLAAVQAKNELSLEVTIRADSDGRILAWAGEAGVNLWLERRAGRLAFGLRTGARGPSAYPAVDLFELPAGVPAHLVVTYEPGRLTAYLDGEPRVESSEPQGGLFHWRAQPLTVGDGAWSGRVEGVALYDRVLGPAEAVEAHRLYQAKRAARPPIPRSVVVGRLVARSRTPTLAEISPYREALVTAVYEVERVISGPPVPGDLRVVEWAVQDGLERPLARPGNGDRLRLTLESFDRQPQLESVYLGDTLDGPPGPLYYAVESIASP